MARLQLLIIMKALSDHERKLYLLTPVQPDGSRKSRVTQLSVPLMLFSLRVPLLRVRICLLRMMSD